jgi:hypothetical protein
MICCEVCQRHGMNTKATVLFYCKDFYLDKDMIFHRCRACWGLVERKENFVILTLAEYKVYSVLAS